MNTNHYHYHNHYHSYNNIMTMIMIMIMLIMIILITTPSSPTVNRSFRFCQKLFRSSSQQEGGRGRSLTLLEHVISLASHLHLLEHTTCAQHVLLDAVYRRLDLGARGLLDALDVVVGDSTCTEHTAIGEVLRGEVADGETRKNDVGSQTHALGQLLVDDGPLGIHDGLVLVWIDSNLGLREIWASGWIRWKSG